MNDIQELIEKLHDPNPKKRYEACEDLRVSPSLSADALEALRKTTHDDDPLVADAAKRALDLHAPKIPDETPESDPSPTYEPPLQVASGSPNSPEYVFGLERRIIVLEMELKHLTKDINLRNDYDEPKRRKIPNSWVLSPNFFERAFAIWGHVIVAQLVIAIPFILLSLLLLWRPI